MFKSTKIRLLAIIFLAILFLAQNIQILNLSFVNSNLKDENEIIKSSENFKEILGICAKKGYFYEIKDAFGSVIASNLPKLDDNLIFYETKFKEDSQTYSLKIAKEKSQSATKVIFHFILALIATLILAYMAYLIALKSHDEAKKMMNTFFNDAMHEIKTPLGVAFMNLEMLELRNKHTHRIKSALKQMKLVFEDIEYYIKHSKIAFPLVKIELCEFLRQRIKFLSTIANVKNIVIEQEIPSEIFIFMSEVEATRLIDNTISNAIKYSDPGSKILVSLSLSDGEKAEFSVRDFGCGIADTKAIWERYSRENTAQGGFGLGLNIVRSICDKFGVSYNVVSKVGEGSVFSYKIPIYKEKFLDEISDVK